MFLWKYFLDETNILISRLWVKQITLHNVVGFIQTVKSLNKKTYLPWGRGNSVNRWPSDLNCTINYSLGIQPAALSCRFWPCKTPQSRKPIPQNKNLSRHRHDRDRNRDIYILLILFLWINLIHWASASRFLNADNLTYIQRESHSYLLQFPLGGYQMTHDL